MELSLAIASLAKHSDKSAEVQQEDEDSERWPELRDRKFEWL
jgi:hypothetical protein